MFESADLFYSIKAVPFTEVMYSITAIALHRTKQHVSEHQTHILHGLPLSISVRGCRYGDGMFAPDEGLKDLIVVFNI